MKTLMVLTCLISLHAFAEDIDFKAESIIENQCVAANRPDQCSLKKIPYSDNSFLVMGPYTYAEISSELITPLPHGEEEKRLRKWYIAFSHSNDNVQMVTGHKDWNEGDDFGFTSGTEIKVGAILDQTYDVGVALIGELYTTPVGAVKNSEGHIVGTYSNQYFRNKTNLEFFISNAHQGKLHFWDARIGLVNVSSDESLSILDGSWQQRMIHKFMNSTGLPKVLTYTNVNDQQSTQWGTYFSALWGMQKTLKINKRLDLVVKSTAGVTVSSLKNDSSIKSLTGADLRMKLNDNYKVGVGIELIQTKHSAGLLKEIAGKVFVEGKQNDFVLKASQYKGHLMNNVSYNGPNLYTGNIDTIYTLQIKHYLEPK